MLGIQRGASDEEIKKAYRAKCKRWHPDLNPNDPTAEEHFKEVQAAYDAITKGETQQQAGGYGYGQQGYSNPYGGRAATSRTAITAARTTAIPILAALISTRSVSGSTLAATSSRAVPATTAPTAPRCRPPATSS